MTELSPWDDGRFLREHLRPLEQQALEVAGYGGRSGLGDGPVLLVVDVTMGFCGPEGSDLAGAVAIYPHACGPAAWQALPRIRVLVDAARAAGLPTIFTRPFPPRSAAQLLSRWEDKNRRQLAVPPDAYDIVPETGYAADDPLLEKEAPSAFFGSPLARWLTGLGCDSVIICGTTTSGCVRATAVDAFSHNLKVTVAADACFDRVGISHDVSLFDLHLKYGDVLPVAALLDRLPAPVAGGDAL